MAVQGVTEQLKADDMMKWVGMVNNIRNCADEIIRNELIYN
ncbi:MAG: TnpV protein [Bacteroidetes bacterium]|nr:TnpV protein [Bacteroidota bacterium]